MQPTHPLPVTSFSSETQKPQNRALLGAFASPRAYGPVLIHWPASPTMPTGTAPERLTFCTLGPAATIVVSCKIGNTVDMFQSRGSTAVITSLMFLEPLRAASIFDWMLRSQIPVRFDGACTSAPGSGVRVGGVDVAGCVGVDEAVPGPAGGVAATGVGALVVGTGVDCSAGQP